MLWILDDADVPKRPIKVFSLEIFILSLKVMRFSSSLKKGKKKSPWLPVVHCQDVII